MRQPACLGWFLCLTFTLSIASLQLCGQEPAADSKQVSPTAAGTLEKSRQNTVKKGDTPGSAHDDMRFGVGDLLEVSVYGIPELSTKARISSSGDIYLPLIDYVHIEGLTSQEAQAIIEKRLADGGYVNNPHVQIFVADYSSQAVTILGEVARPGPYPILGERRLYDLFSAAGGL